ncbi:hypothetical protein [Stenotrophomonas sp. PS02298]|uniref:hypothetical protein n=1 Tax=Stenotrophomonas sp. PS02298 TaxID=2991424 RepID=UPI00249B0ADC|nr:hypothetical protein [Stenotrophomonas sp. PS02298]
MSGGKNKPQTIGYWYRPLIHFGLCRGPIDALLEIRGGDRTAWNGVVTESTRLYVDAMNLWGGEKSEGGIAGYLDVMFGEPEQQPNDYLTKHLGSRRGACRGKASIVFRGGRWGAMNPYPKAASFKLRRITQGWDEGCWYPGTAQIALLEGLPEFSLQWRKTAAAPYLFSAPGDVAGWSPQPADYDDVIDTSSSISWSGGVRGAVGIAWLHITFPKGVTRSFALDIKTNYDDSGCVVGVHGVSLGPSAPPAAVSGYPMAEGVNIVIPAVRVGFECWVAFACVDGKNIFTGEDYGSPTNHRMLHSSTAVIASEYAMNPAHILYQSITDSRMGGESPALVNEASFRAAADRLFAEGFGLCTAYDPDQETLVDFRQRICNVAGLSCSRSRADGRWHLDLIRGAGDADDLPVLVDDDILDFQEEVTALDDAVNQVVVEWFDSVAKEKRTTAPVQALGAIQTAGGVISQTKTFLEIPVESLALRVADRELRNLATPGRRINLTCVRTPWAWRAGTYFRLQAPRRGIADMVCMVGEIDAGTLRSGAVRIVALQDVFGMADSVYVQSDEPAIELNELRPSLHQRLFEIPYHELAQAMTPAELAALPEDVGYMAAVAVRANGGDRYALYTAGPGEALSGGYAGSWCPAAAVSGGDDARARVFTVAAQDGLDRVVIGSAGLWGDEIVRLDAMDPVAGTMTLGRGCGDTAPREHPEGELIFFYDDFMAVDGREYVHGETVTAKALTQGPNGVLSAGMAPMLSATMASRQVRPYAPGRLRINAALPPAEVIGAFDVSWAHRDRLLQADQLIDAEAASIGPEPGTTYTVRAFVDDVLSDEQAGITGTTASVPVLSGNGAGRVEVWAVRDGLDSWQAATARFDYRAIALRSYADQDGTTYADQAGIIYQG